MPATFRNAFAFLNTTFRDGAFRYAVKFGLSGVLAVFIALYIRLPEPTWALFTVFVLMVAQYVGAIAEKSIFRIIGTAVGGLLGYVLTAGLEQEPVIFLLLVGLITAFCTAMFGQSRYPYAFLLCGLTTVVVTSNGLGNPDASWQYMLVRVEEVSVGIIATILIQCLFWPRYARVEFGQNVRIAFADLRDCFQASSQIFLATGNPVACEQAANFPARITALRGMLDFAGRESHAFSERLPTYFGLTSCLSRIASAIVTLGNSLPAQSFYREAITASSQALHRAIEEALTDLASEQSTSQTRQRYGVAVDDAFAVIEKQLAKMRSNPKLLEIGADEAMIMGLHLLALDDIRGQIHQAHALLDSLPLGPLDRSKDIESYVSPIPPKFWIRNGLKSGLAVVIALVLDNWLNPPGGSMLVLGAWVFTATNASSPGGQGDRRAYHYSLISIGAIMALSLILLFAHPMLSSYAVMNTIIFTWLFVWGYLSYSTRGMTIPMQVGMLGMVGVLGLNGQQPVTFQSIVDFFFGIAVSTILASVIQRTIWPSLPQWEMRNRFVELIQICRDLLDQGPQSIPLWRKARVALIPGEISQRIAVLRQPICPAGETERLRDYLHTLQRISSHLVVTTGQLSNALPAEQAERGKALIHQMEATIADHLALHQRSMAETTPLKADLAALPPLLETWKAWVHEVRTHLITHQQPILHVIRVMGLSGRYELAGRDLIQAGEQARSLRMPLYMGDYAL